MKPIYNYRVILFKRDVFVKPESFTVFIFGNFKNYNILCFAVYSYDVTAVFYGFLVNKNINNNNSLFLNGITT